MENITTDNEQINGNSFKGYVHAFLWVHSWKSYARAFLWLFFGVFALVKAFHILDYYFNVRMTPKYKLRSTEHKWEEMLMLNQEMKKMSDSQMEKLRQRNKKLEGLILELEECNRQLINENYIRPSAMDNEEMGKEPTNPYNVFIKNNHFHLINQMFVNGGHFDLNIANSSLPPKSEPNIWMKYLKQRKSLMPCQSIVDDKSMIENTPGRTEPTIMGTEEMVQMQGMSSFTSISA
ncbi:uncharacterized protein LOC111077612 [Drosophila obscura]|uniref:uncharacterized protein LOC111077612 n=1 Tax=Drosophila obscura TaxID=7282 RepID=UPI001BB255AE|nr:uncharacterized protein LOC111077612 [Drosophila obscura]